MIKKLLYLVMVLTSSVLVFTSCDDFPESSLYIVKSDVIFDANANTGSVKVAYTNPYTVKSSENWCTATVSDSIVTVKVTQNSDTYTRNAYLTISDGTHTKSVTVSQYGSYISVAPGDTIQAYTDEASTSEISFSASQNYTIKVSEDATDWLSYTLKGSKMIINATANTSGSPRGGEIIITTADGHTRVIHVTQYVIGDFAGNWTLSTVRGGTATTMNTLFAVNKDTITITGLLLDFPIVTTYHTTSLHLNFFQVMGAVTIGSANYYAILNPLSTDGYLSYSSDISIDGGISIEGKKTTLDFQDNGSWSGKVVSGFYIGAYTSNTTLSGKTRKYTLATYEGLTFTKQ